MRERHLASDASLTAVDWQEGSSVCWVPGNGRVKWNDGDATSERTDETPATPLFRRAGSSLLPPGSA